MNQESINVDQHISKQEATQYLLIRHEWKSAKNNGDYVKELKH